MLEEKTTTKPSLWNQALKVVKGDNTTELVEQFTQEMTLVAEGLCEDQARLRKAVDGLIRQAEGEHEKSAQDYAELTQMIDAQSAETGRQLKELSRRLDALEAQQNKPAPKGKLRLMNGDVISRITVLAGIICGTWLIVTILNLFM
ncbi:MAG: hypothetical protein IJ438_10480 [Clostridia bacterium]|nr:hypothetical protein [Clostridia bacterium]